MHPIYFYLCIPYISYILLYIHAYHWLLYICIYTCTHIGTILWCVCVCVYMCVCFCVLYMLIKDNRGKWHYKGEQIPEYSWLVLSQSHLCLGCSRITHWIMRDPCWTTENTFFTVRVNIGTGCLKRLWRYHAWMY